MKLYYDIKGMATAVRAEEIDADKTRIETCNKGISGAKIMVYSENLKGYEMSVDAVEQTDVDTLLFISRDWNKIAIQFEDGDFQTPFFNSLKTAVENHHWLNSVSYLKLYADAISSN